MASGAYVVTAAERERCLAALARVLFAAVETPGVGEESVSEIGE